MSPDDRALIAAAITQALLTYQPTRGLDNTLKRGNHIIDHLATEGWHITKETR